MNSLNRSKLESIKSIKGSSENLNKIKGGRNSITKTSIMVSRWNENSI
jgi:hypothetical protein